MRIGTKLGAYEVIAKIGEGGMGEVYRRSGREARPRWSAIKVLPPLFTRDNERLSRFVREARVLAALNHPNIAAIYGLEESLGMPDLTQRPRSSWNWSKATRWPIGSRIPLTTWRGAQCGQSDRRRRSRWRTKRGSSTVI